jgi:hypothetical protein
MQPDEYNPLPPEAHAFLDGRMDADAEADFRRRLNDDSALRENVEKLQGALAALKTLPVRDPGAEFTQRVMGRVREAELIERARRRIVGARTPLWQHFAQVAAGAVAAALVLALTGVFNPAVQEVRPDPLDGVMATATEDDLRPALAEQQMRLRRVSDHIGTLAGADAEAQRMLLRAELEYPRLQRRNLWLSGQTAALPLERRREIQGYLDSLSRALAALDEELAESAAGGRPVDIARARNALRAVKAPQGIEGHIYLSLQGNGASSALRVSTPENWPDEVRAYATLREATYSHDDARILAACEAYLRPYARGGKFVRAARLHEVACLVRLGRPAEAAQRYEQTFGLFEEKLEPADVLWLQEWMSQAELDQLRAARSALRGGSGD